MAECSLLREILGFVPEIITGKQHKRRVRQMLEIYGESKARCPSDNPLGDYKEVKDG